IKFVNRDDESRITFLLPVCRCQGTGKDFRLAIADRRSCSFEILVERIDKSPQRFGFALASLRQQRNASAVPHSGDNSAVVPPVPISNTEVKRCSPDGSTAIGRARVGHRQNKMPGGFIPSGILLFWTMPTRARQRRQPRS